jgi:DNA primase
MLDAGNDTTKKSQLVNEIAETIAKIDKTEDFTRQQDYIRQCSQVLKIDEQGLINLVNKFIREKLQKKEQQFTRDQEKNAPSADDDLSPEAIAAMEAMENGGVPPADNFFNPDERQERELVKILLRFGDKPFSEEDQNTVADYIFHLPYDFESLADNEIVKRILREYKQMYDEDNLPDKKWFLYHSDHDVTALVVQIMEDKEAELSPKWKEEFEIDTVYGDNAYLKDTISTTNYLMLRKIRKMIMENQQEMEKSTDFELQINCIKMHKHLKQLENELTNGLGTVIFR